MNLVVLLSLGCQCSTHRPKYTEVRFASFLSGGFITDIIIVNSPERKLAKRTSAVLKISAIQNVPPKELPILLSSALFRVKIGQTAKSIVAARVYSLCL